MSEPIRDIIWLPPKRITAKEILEAVAHRHDMTVAEMLAASRKMRFVRARQEAMWEIRQRTKLSLPQIAGRMRIKDHTTILHGVRKHQERLAARQEAA